MYDAAARVHKHAGAPTNFPNAEAAQDAVEEALLALARSHKPGSGSGAGAGGKSQTGRSGYLGVVQSGLKWNVTVHHNAKRRHIGQFDTKEVCANLFSIRA